MLTFTADGAEELVFFGVDVSASDDALTDGGTDFSVFSFVAASPLLDGWGQIPGADFGPDPFLAVVEFETGAASLASGTYVLGTLSVDFAAAGVTADTTVGVSLDAIDSVIGVEIPGDFASFTFVDVDLTAASTTFTTPGGLDGGGDGGVIPEPMTTSTLSVALAALGLVVARRRTLA